MRKTQVGSPVASANGDDAQLGNDDGSSDSSGDFLGGLDAETDVALGVTNDDNGLESSSLTSTGLLLDGLDLFHEIPGQLLWSSEPLAIPRGQLMPSPTL